MMMETANGGGRQQAIGQLLYCFTARLTILLGACWAATMGNLLELYYHGALLPQCGS